MEILRRDIRFTTTSDGVAIACVDSTRLVRDHRDDEGRGEPQRVWRIR